MRTAGRAAFAAILGLGLAAGAGCGSKPAPPAPDTPITPDPNPGPPAPPPDPVYEMDPAKHVVPAGPVVGRLAGERVSGEARIEAGELVFQKPAGAPGDDWRVSVKLPPEALKGEPYRAVFASDKTPGASVLVDFPKEVQLAEYDPAPGADPGARKRTGWKPAKVMGWEGGCALTLELGPRAAGKVPGKVFLALPEMETQADPRLRNFLAGTFEASVTRLPTDPPGPEDVPYVRGAVTVRGAPPGAVLMVGYAANPTPELFPLGGVEVPLGEPLVAQFAHDKPRVTSLLAGDEKDTPSRYEHTRLAPGRYLVFAELRGGPAAWKWVDVGPKGTVTLDLTIDAAQTGGVEVNAPLGALGKVQLAPADEPGRPMLGQNLFLGIAMQMRLEQDIVARKALVKNLAPGRYEVRAGGDVRVVEVVAGKTVELDFDKKLPPPAPDPAPEPRPKG